MSNPYIECQKFETADRRDREQRDEAIKRANDRYERKRAARLDHLTVEERAIIEAADRAKSAQPVTPGDVIRNFADTCADVGKAAEALTKPKGKA